MVGASREENERYNERHGMEQKVADAHVAIDVVDAHVRVRFAVPFEKVRVVVDKEEIPDDADHDGIEQNKELEGVPKGQAQRNEEQEKGKMRKVRSVRQ